MSEQPCDTTTGKQRLRTRRWGLHQTIERQADLSSAGGVADADAPHEYSASCFVGPEQLVKGNTHPLRSFRRPLVCGETHAVSRVPRKHQRRVFRLKL